MATLTETAAALAKGRVTAVELVAAALIRTRASEYVFTELFEEQAMAQARAADIRRANQCQLGPLDGVPFAVKDLFDVRGSKTLLGSLTRVGEPAATADATVVAAMKAQGMIALGKTGMNEFAFSGLGLNPNFGTPTADFPGVEPRAPGGSSSGSAVAVQRGIVCAAIGSDTGGSIRVPAAFNGLVGFKSSPERYDLGGVHPLAPSLDSLGPMARTVRDCVLLDAAMRGLTDPSIEARSLSGNRFVVEQGVLDDARLAPAVLQNLLHCVERLRAAGAWVEFAILDSVQQVRQLIVRDGWLGAIEAWEQLRDVVLGPQGAQVDRRVSARLHVAAKIPAERARTIRSARARLIASVATELDGAVLIMPTVMHVAPLLAPLEQDDELFTATNIATLSLTMIGSFLNMPGLAMPSGTDAQGLPTSMLFSLPQGHDDELLACGLAIEQTLQPGQGCASQTLAAKAHT
ncbi:amidase family protein [Pseudomonas sp. WJP1]|uniref:amidase family protein n=1 Tax=Pseudomonas sp. WJP1 TaxID=2986947 RepID=UPI00234A438A|nr:amidase family protein [Pseudomonas sp. WJP1]WCM48547.1 amidase family protein [Pseudomonas sp. WJP1]